MGKDDIDKVVNKRLFIAIDSLTEPHDKLVGVQKEDDGFRDTVERLADDIEMIKSTKKLISSLEVEKIANREKIPWSDNFYPPDYTKFIKFPRDFLERIIS